MLDTLDKFKMKKDGVELAGEELEEEKNKYKRRRHGLGIQLFGKNKEGKDSKYAGEWENDQVHGDGHYVYHDGSEYKGNFNYGVFQGFGEFQWPLSASEGLKKKHVYKGMWENGKMHGKGEFIHADGRALKGYFANNLFELTQKGKKYFVNPLEN
jgi:hypothetical protein